MEEIRTMETASYADSSPYDLEFSGRIIGGVGWTFAADQTGNTTSPADDYGHRALGVPEVVQSQEPLIRAPGQDWLHSNAIIEGGYPKALEPTSAGKQLATAFIDFAKIIPASAINATTRKMFLRGTFDRTRQASTPPTALSGTLRPFVRTIDRDPNVGFLRPKWTYATIGLKNQDDIQYPIRFEQDTFVHGILLRVVDDSATGPEIRSDGVVKDVRMDLTNAMGTREILRASWGQLRTDTAKRAGWSSDDWDRSTGVALATLRDERNRMARGAMLFKNGDSLNLHFDTTRTADEQFSSVTASTDDFVVATIWGFVPVKGTGDRAAQVRDLGRAERGRGRARGVGRARRSRRAQNI